MKRSDVVRAVIFFMICVLLGIAVLSGLSVLGFAPALWDKEICFWGEITRAWHSEEKHYLAGDGWAIEVGWSQWAQYDVEDSVCVCASPFAPSGYIYGGRFEQCGKGGEK